MIASNKVRQTTLNSEPGYLIGFKSTDAAEFCTYFIAKSSNADIEKNLESLIFAANLIGGTCSSASPKISAETESYQSVDSLATDLFKRHFKKENNKTYVVSENASLKIFFHGKGKIIISNGQHSFELRLPKQFNPLVTLYTLIQFENELIKMAPQVNQTCINIKHGQSLIQQIRLKIKKEIETREAEQHHIVQFSKIIAKSPYHEMFPLARKRNRIITLICGPTNSGKTYTTRKKVIDRIDKNSEVIALYPLRLLALENFEDFLEAGFPCNLITGEERDTQAGANITCATIETLNVKKHYNIAIIDEGQLLFEQRSAAYARALIGVNADELMITCSPESLEALKWLFEDILHEYTETITLERLTTLNTEPTKININDLKPHDLLVDFSTKKLHEWADICNKNKLSAGLIYGRLSPIARRNIIKDYHNGAYDIVIATDAIGLGLNLPCKRVIFASTEKFDGKTKRNLTDYEIRQIAGRAGRFGKFNPGTCALLNGCSLDSETLGRIVSNAPATIDRPDKIKVAPDHSVFEIQATLSETIRYWQDAIKQNKLYTFDEDSICDLTNKAQILDNLANTHKLNKPTSIKLLFVTYPSSRDKMYENYYISTVKKCLNEEQITMPSYKNKRKVTLSKMEECSTKIGILTQLKRIFPERLPDEDELHAETAKIGKRIAEELKKRYKI